MDTKAFDTFDNQTYYRFSNPSLIEKNLQTLLGIITGITCDAIINPQECKELIHWLDRHKHYEDKAPYSEVIALLREAMEDGVLTREEGENIIWFCQHYIKKTAYFNVATAGLQKLIGIVNGIVLDGKINIAELAFLDQWLEENEYLKNTWPYDELYSLTTKIIADKVIAPEEHTGLLGFCQALIGDADTNTNSIELIKTLKTGFFKLTPRSSLQNVPFVSQGSLKSLNAKRLLSKSNSLAVMYPTPLAPVYIIW